MKKTFIKIVAGVVALIVAYVSFQLYSTYKEGERVRTESAALITEYEELKGIEAQFQKQQEVLEAERVRCSAYIRQDSGEFSEFQYCKRYLELTDSLE
jgi:hypothetical protein